MAGRNLHMQATGRNGGGSRRPIAYLAAALALIAIGIAIGNRIAAPGEPAQTATAVNSASPTAPTVARQRPRVSIRTRSGTVAAAAQAVTAFDGDVLLKPARLRVVVEQIASVSSRARLIEAFDQASAETRAKLGADTIPRPVIVLRSVPVGYRVERFSADEAEVAVWYVGIVGSGAGVQPQQSWRTQIVTLVWENRAWKVSSFESTAGPTPPLSGTETTQAPGELFTTIPRFEAFRHAEP